jgi:hypothetical protein
VQLAGSQLILARAHQPTPHCSRTRSSGSPRIGRGGGLITAVIYLRKDRRSTVVRRQSDLLKNLSADSPTTTRRGCHQ